MDVPNYTCIFLFFHRGDCECNAFPDDWRCGVQVVFCTGLCMGLEESSFGLLFLGGAFYNALLGISGFLKQGALNYLMPPTHSILSHRALYMSALTASPFFSRTRPWLCTLTFRHELCLALKAPCASNTACKRLVEAVPVAGPLELSRRDY